MRASISGRKCRISPWTGHAAASPSAQMVWPSTWLLTSTACRSRASRPRPGHALQHAPHPAGALAARRALAAAFVLVEIGDAARWRVMMSVDLSMTMTAAVPRPDLQASTACRNPSCRSSHWLAGMQGIGRRRPGSPRADCPSRRARRRNARRSARASGIAHLLLDHARLVRRGRRSGTAWCRYCWAGRARRTMSRRDAGCRATTAMVSTLLTVVGAP